MGSSFDAVGKMYSSGYRKQWVCRVRARRFFKTCDVLVCDFGRKELRDPVEGNPAVKEVVFVEGRKSSLNCSELRGLGKGRIGDTKKKKN